MIQTIVDEVKAKYAQKGFDTIVATEEVVVNDTEMCMQLGNDTIILTGFVFDCDTNGGENERISITSPTDQICDKASGLASFGIGRFKVMTGYMIVKRFNSETTQELLGNFFLYGERGTQSPLTINFVRISPKRIN